jgi:hypothetical protein
MALVMVLFVDRLTNISPLLPVMNGIVLLISLLSPILKPAAGLSPAAPELSAFFKSIVI